MTPLTYAVSGDTVSTGSSFTFTMPDWIVSLFAESEANDYTVTFHGNGHTNWATMDVESMTFDKEKALLPNKFEKSWYTFQGWNTWSTATTAKYADQESVMNLTTVESGNVDMYAIWKANIYDVAFNKNEGVDHENQVIGNMSNQSFTYDITGALSDNAYSRSWYTFLGWSRDASATTATYSDKENVSNLTTTSWDTVNLYAVWSANKQTPYKVEHYQQEIGGWDNYKLVDTDNLSWETYTVVTPHVNTYVWFHSPDALTWRIAWDGKTVIKYYYTRNQYDLKFAPAGGTEVAKITYYFDQELGDLPESSRIGYDFSGWYLGDVLYTGTTKMPAWETTVTAEWTARSDTKYHVYHYFKNVGEEKYTLNNDYTQELSWVTASELTLAEKAKTGLEGFTYSRGGLSGTENWPDEVVTTGFINADGSTNLYLYYIRNKHKVTVNAGLGVDGVSGNANEVEYGAPITLGVTMNPCYHWVNWTGEQTSQISGFSFNMPDKDVTYTANGAIDAYTLTVSTNTGANTENTTQDYNCWSEVTLTWDANVGYTWTGWLLSGLGDNTWQPWKVYTFTMPNRNVTAVAKVVTNIDTDYQVRHEKQKLDGTYDVGTKVTNHDTTVYNLTWETDSSITPALESYLGFTPPEETQTTTILWNWTTKVTYTYTRNKYDVVLHEGHGIASVSWAGKYLYETGVNVSALVKEGYNQSTVKWAGTYTDNHFNMPYNDVEMTASADPITYHINYHLNSGSLVTDKNTYTIDSADIRLDQPTRTWYTFQGWTGTDVAEATKVVTINSWSIGNRDYYAKWSANDVGITVNYYKEELDGNYTWAESGHDAGLSDSEVTGTLKDYTGFKTPASQTIKVEPDGSAVIDYYYTRNSYPVTLTANTGVQNLSYTGTYCTTTGCKYQSTVQITWDLMNWYQDFKWTGFTTENSFTMPEDSVNVSASATATVYTISYALNWGSISGQKTSYTVEDENFTLKHPIRTGYNFIGWTWSNGDVAQVDVTIAKNSTTGNKAYTANWSAHAVDVKIVHKRMDIYGHYPDSLVESGVDSTHYDADTAYTFEPNDYWTGFTKPASQTITVKADGTTVVTFEYVRNKYQVSLTKGKGIASVSSDKAEYYYEEPVVITGTMKSGYEGLTWTGTYETDHFNMPYNDVDMTANAVPTTYHITYNTNGGHIENEVLEYNVETPTFTLVTGSKVWYDFWGWTGTDVTTPTISVEIRVWSTGDRVFNAKWNPRHDTDYVVHHYVKDIGHDTYTEDTNFKNELTGTTDAVLRFSELATGSIPCATYSSGSLTWTTSWPWEIETETTIKPDGSTHIYLYYTRNAYNVNLSGDSHIDSLIGARTWDEKYECGATVEVSATNKSGYHFKQWIDKSTGARGSLQNVVARN